MSTPEVPDRGQFRPPPPPLTSKTLWPPDPVPGPMPIIPVAAPPWLAVLLAFLTAATTFFSSWAALQSSKNGTRAEAIEQGQAVTHEKVEAATQEATAARKEASEAHKAARTMMLGRPPFDPDPARPENQSSPVDGRDKNPPTPGGKK